MAARLTPAQVETIARVWVETGNQSECARQAGCSPQSAGRYIVASGLDSTGKLYADACAKGVRLAVATVAKARRKISEALDSVEEVKDLAALAAQAHDNARVCLTAQLNHAKLSGALIDRTDVTSGGQTVAAVVLMPPLDPDGRRNPAEDPVAAEPGATD